MISRRIFVRNALIVSAGTWAAVLGIGSLTGLVRTRFFPRRLPETVLSWLSSLENGATAGEELDLGSRQRQDLVKSLEQFLTASSTDSRLLEAALRERIQVDFAAGRIVAARGWRLSETEVGVFLIQKGIRKGLYAGV